MCSGSGARWFATLVCAWALPFGCGIDGTADLARDGKEEVPESEIVARVAGEPIRRADALAAVDQLSPILQREFRTTAGREEFLHAYVDKLLLGREARRRGFHEQPEIRRQVQALETRLIIRALLDEQAAAGATEDELRTWYADHRDTFRKPEAVRVARLRAKDSAQAQALRARLLEGASIAVVAAQTGGDAAGDPVWAVRGGGELPEPAIEAAFALAAPGAISEPIPVSDGLLVLVLLERRAARVPPFEEVRGEVASAYEPIRQRRLYDDLLRRLRASCEIEIYGDRLRWE